LPREESPAWSGLPTNVEKILKAEQSQYTISKIWQLQDINDEEIKLDSLKAEEKGKPKKKEDVPQVQWLKDLGNTVKKYIDILPEKMAKLDRNEDSITNPLFRFLEREVTVASKLLSTIKANLNDIQNFCDGKGQSTTQLRDLCKDIHGGQIPASWKKYIVAQMPVTDWITDYKKRLDQFSRVAQ